MDRADSYAQAWLMPMMEQLYAKYWGEENMVVKDTVGSIALDSDLFFAIEDKDGNVIAVKKFGDTYEILNAQSYSEDLWLLVEELVKHG